MSVVRLDEEDLDEEDLAILAEVKSKGYYHNRPKSVACAPPQKVSDAPQRLDSKAEEEKASRTTFDEFQKKWDCFDNDNFLEAMEAELMKAVGHDKELAEAFWPTRTALNLSTEFKVLLLGDTGVGKSAFLQRHLTGEFARASSTNREVCQLHFETNCGPICFNVWEINSRALERSFMHGQAAIVMFDVNSRASWRSVPNWMRDVNSHCEIVPTVLVGNKSDVDAVQSRKLDSLRKPYQKKKQLQYYELSVKSNTNFEKPFLWLARRLVDCPALELVGEVATKPHAKPNPELFTKHNHLLATALSSCVPDVDHYI